MVCFPSYVIHYHGFISRIFNRVPISVSVLKLYFKFDIVQLMYVKTDVDTWVDNINYTQMFAIVSFTRRVNGLAGGT